MSLQENTRLFAGSELWVDDLASGWIVCGEIRSASGFGEAAAEIDITTAASDIEDESRLGLPGGGEANIGLFLNMDDDFQQEVEIMRTNRETRTFKLVLPEGVKTEGTFLAFVIDGGITGQSNNVFEFTLQLGLNSRLAWAVPA